MLWIRHADPERWTMDRLTVKHQAGDATVIEAPKLIVYFDDLAGGALWVESAGIPLSTFPDHAGFTINYDIEQER